MGYQPRRTVGKVRMDELESVFNRLEILELLVLPMYGNKMDQPNVISENYRNSSIP